MVKKNPKQRTSKFPKSNKSHPIQQIPNPTNPASQNSHKQQKHLPKTDQHDQHDKHQIAKQKHNLKKKYKNNLKHQTKSNEKQFSHILGKSIFKVIPENYDGDQQDKFAALKDNCQQQNHHNNNYQQFNQVQQQQYNVDEQFGYNNQQQIQQSQQSQQQQTPNYLNKDQQNNAQQLSQQQQKDDQNQQYQSQQLMKNEDNQINQQQQQDQNIDISIINLKIQQTLQVLMNVKRLGDGKSRKYFIDKLTSYAHRYYGYNVQLIDHFLNFFNPTEMIQFFQSNETQRPLTIRTNTLKIRRKQLAQLLIQRGVNLDPLAQWSKVGIKIYNTKVPIGATPQYLAGYYMLQSASSFLPVLALDPKMNQRILDLAAAPGGKTTYISQLMKNTGILFANDIKKDRLRALQFNLSRLGISNTIITCRDGRKYHDIFPNTFDRVLLDAPCTGLGVISKDQSIKTKRTLLDLYKNSHLQKQLLLSAIDCTKIGGVVVYSTCSVSPIQNQEVVNYALKKRDIKIIDMDNFVQLGQPGFVKFIDKRYHLDLKKTKRIYPHVHNMDGFYFAKFIKITNQIKNIQNPRNQSNQVNNSAIQ